MTRRITLEVMVIVVLLGFASVAMITLFHLYNGSNGSSTTCVYQCTSQTLYPSTTVSTSTATTTATTTVTTTAVVSSTVLTTTTVTVQTTKTITTTATYEGEGVYSINFNSYANGSEPPNWNYDSTWSIQDGQYQSIGSTGYTVAYYTGANFSNFRYSDTATGLSSCNQSPPVLGMMFDMKDRLDGYEFWGDIDKIQVVKWVGGVSTVLVSEEIGQIAPTGSFVMSVTTNGNDITANWNDQYAITVSDSTYSSGYIGLGTYNCGAGFNDLSVGSFGSGTIQSGQRAGLYLAVSQTGCPEAYSTGEQFMTSTSCYNNGLFDTILLYSQLEGGSSGLAGDPAHTLQLADGADELSSSFKMIVDIGFNLDSSADWSNVQAFISELATYPSVGWVGIEGEHATWDPSGCEFGGTTNSGSSCPSIGQAWGSGALSETTLESDYEQFDSYVATAGLQVAHYYLDFGASSWRTTQQQIWVTQWPACGNNMDVMNCSQIPTQTSEIQEGNTAPYIGISGGLSTTAADFWNPTVDASGVLPGCPCQDTVISTYISTAEQQPPTTRQLILFETGSYGGIGDTQRSIFTEDLQAAIAQYSDFLYPTSSIGSPSNSSTSATTTAIITSAAPSTMIFLTSITVKLNGVVIGPFGAVKREDNS